jgi:hypothetical protein
MKKLLFAAILIVAFSTASFSKELVAEGKTHSVMGDYKIEKTDTPVTINGEEFKAFLITYKNSPLEVKVVVRKGQNCKNYLVLSDELSVQYVCNKNYFGVERLDKSLEKDGYSTADGSINRSEYFRQKVLSHGNLSDIESTQLIAAYFPQLMNSADNTLAAK